MLDFLKTFGKGILYIILLPVFLLILALGAVFAFGVFIFQLFRAIVLFFAGRSIFNKLPEEVDADMKMQGMEYDPATKNYVPIGQAGKSQVVQQGNTTNILCQNLNVTPDQLANANFSNQNPNYINNEGKSLDYTEVNVLPNNGEPAQISYDENSTIDNDNTETGGDNDGF